MGVVGWIVLAFVLGLIFGRLTARSAGRGSVEANVPTGSGFPLAQPAAGRATGVQTTVATTIDAPVSLSQGDVSSLIAGTQGAYKVVLLDHGPNMITTIKAIRDVVRVDLKGAKDLAERTPSVLTQVLSLDEGNRILQRFQGIASVRLEGGSPTALPPELERMLTDYARATAANVTKST